MHDEWNPHKINRVTELEDKLYVEGKQILTAAFAQILKTVRKNKLVKNSATMSKALTMDDIRTETDRLMKLSLYKSMSPATAKKSATAMAIKNLTKGISNE